ncbi:hypothetical protein GCM10007885_43760 [Methylobacterium gnaphalii]|nr:hypothetical protein GCM10007885_43760 [Methylobacterium gnaphalii]
MADHVGANVSLIYSASKIGGTTGRASGSGRLVVQQDAPAYLPRILSIAASISASACPADSDTHSRRSAVSVTNEW